MASSPTKPKPAPTCSTTEPSERAGVELGAKWTLEQSGTTYSLHIGDKMVPLERDSLGCFRTLQLFGSWPTPALIAQQLLRYSPDFSPLAHPAAP